jgi:ABC-type lipoprotein release transport system permease subunit
MRPLNDTLSQPRSTMSILIAFASAALAAAYMPSRRAARVDPASALRSE